MLMDNGGDKMDKKIEGVILDMDGVMVDSYAYHFEAWKKFVKNHGINLTDKEILDSFGRRNAEVLGDFFKRQLTEEEINRYSQEKEALYRELHKKDIKALPGLVEMLEDLKQAGIRIAIGSSAPKENIEFVIKSLNINLLIDAYVHAGMIKIGKPHPGVFLKAADLIKVTPEKCLVFEDSFPGIEAGLRAGMKVIAVATTHRPEEIKGAHGVIKDFQGLTAESIEKMLFEV